MIGPHLEGRPTLPAYPGHDHDRPLERDDDTDLEVLAGGLAVRPRTGRVVAVELDDVVARFDLAHP